MKELEKIYRENRMQYFCNRSGDIFIPEDDDNAEICTPEDLPDDIRPILEKYWDENNYIVRLDKKPGVLEQRYYTAAEVAESMGLNPDDLPVIYMMCMYKKVKAIASKLEKDPILAGCMVITGQWTDPEGHEFAVFINFFPRKPRPTLVGRG